MQSGPRTRRREFPLNEGSMTTVFLDGRPPVTIKDSNTWSRQEAWYMSDWVGRSDRTNPMYSEKWRRSGGLVNLDSIIGVDRLVYNDHVMDRPDTLDGWLPSTSSLTPLGNVDLETVLARTGPMTPKVNVPLFLAELRDVPHMIRHAGDVLHGLSRLSGLNPFRELASANLAYKFGWDPLISDISKIAKTLDFVKKREKFLLKTDEVLGAVSTASLGEFSFHREGKKDAGYPFGNWMLDFSTPRNFKSTTTVKRWMSCRWRLKDFQPLYYNEPPVTPFQAATGLNMANIPLTIWKALPWTWLSDWFVDFSSNILAAQNLLYFEPTDACVMEQRIHRVEFDSGIVIRNTNGGGVVGSCSKLVYDKVTKQRLVDIEPRDMKEAKLPMMDDFKLSVLGSLATLRLLGR